MRRLTKICTLLSGGLLIAGLTACSPAQQTAVEPETSAAIQQSQTTAEESSTAQNNTEQNTVKTAFDNAQMQTDNPEMPTRVLDNGTRINMHFGDTVIPGILNDSETAQALIERLPLTMEFNHYATDYCAVMDEELPYAESDVHNGWLNGDINYEITAPYFAILFDGQDESVTHDNQVNIGVMDCELSQIRNLQGSFEVTIELAEE